MNKFVIITDSCSDLDKTLRTKYDVDYIPMELHYQDKVMEADLDWGEISAKDFYDGMRAGARVKTAQITAAKYTQRFESYLQAGFDVLSISCSSALSASVSVSYKVRDALQEKYPDRKIVCIDSLNSCLGLGLLCIRASELRAEGKTIEETAAWIEEHKLEMNQEFTVDKLTYLKQAGRVSAISAFFGGLLNVKPICISDVKGHNVAVEKVKGRGASIDRLVARFKEEYESAPYQKVYFGHADCIEDGELFKEKILAVLPDKDVEIYFGNIGPIIGASAGPGTIAVHFFGKKVTFDSTLKN